MFPISETEVTFPDLSIWSRGVLLLARLANNETPRDEARPGSQMIAVFFEPNFNRFAELIIAVVKFV